ncbi:hypothetical protein GUITHDRAFT_143525 [Guillardia theta CCMP2712]|uniref:RRM domain-containing protein n=1 Tax=Guillardia theta (strain CCMP2712) TaxID=905079 RepID=L1ISX0_GUITC|nr:hypothetical protein GUITHDRAFT_143525 [Guillardia theta CCMP2712]EKX39313.1 hypothetical protein GUITHDRAFT_143525 [Guillardia theta CCMP2712]|eukprot:XP_005826293.1 hypothetical protein GUITHDRAFT_143525 [Guillardia theta CCMP2712]
MSNTCLVPLLVLTLSTACHLEPLTSIVKFSSSCRHVSSDGRTTRLVLHLRGGRRGGRRGKEKAADKSQRSKAKGMLGLQDLLGLKHRPGAGKKQKKEKKNRDEDKTADNSRNATQTDMEKGFMDLEDLTTNSDCDKAPEEKKLAKQVAALEAYFDLAEGELMANETKTEQEVEESFSSDDNIIDEDEVAHADVRFRREGHDPNPPDDPDPMFAKFKKYYIPFPENNSIVAQQNGIVCRVETHPRSVLDVHVPWYEPDVHYKLSLEEEKKKKTTRVRVSDVSPESSVEKVWELVSKTFLSTQKASQPLEVIVFPDRRMIDFIVNSDSLNLTRSSRSIKIGRQMASVWFEADHKERDVEHNQTGRPPKLKQEKQEEEKPKLRCNDCDQVLVFNLLFNYQKPIKKLFDSCGVITSIKFKYVDEVRKYVARITFDKKESRCKEPRTSQALSCTDTSIKDAHLKCNALIPTDKDGFPIYQINPRVVDNFTKVDRNFNFSRLSHAQMEKIIPGSSYNFDTRLCGGDWYSPPGTMDLNDGDIERGMIAAMTYQTTHKV